MLLFSKTSRPGLGPTLCVPGFFLDRKVTVPLLLLLLCLRDMNRPSFVLTLHTHTHTHTHTYTRAVQKETELI